MNKKIILSLLMLLLSSVPLWGKQEIKQEPSRREVALSFYEDDASDSEGSWEGQNLPSDNSGTLVYEVIINPNGAPIFIQSEQIEIEVEKEDVLKVGR